MSACGEQISWICNHRSPIPCWPFGNCYACREASDGTQFICISSPTAANLSSVQMSRLWIVILADNHTQHFTMRWYIETIIRNMFNSGVAVFSIFCSGFICISNTQRPIPLVSRWYFRHFELVRNGWTGWRAKEWMDGECDRFAGFPAQGATHSTCSGPHIHRPSIH